MTRDQILNEMRTFIEAGGLASTNTIRRWVAMLESDDDALARDAREQARRDAA